MDKSEGKKKTLMTIVYTTDFTVISTTTTGPTQGVPNL